MNHLALTRPFALLGLTLILLTACAPADSAPAADPTASPPPTTAEAVAATHTPLPPPSPTPSSTATRPTTPTADPGWFEPNHFFSQSDYYYYSELLLNVGDSSPVAQVTKGSGWGGGLEPCDTCDLVVIRYAAALSPSQNAEVAFVVALRRHRTLEQAQTSLQEFVDENVQRSGVVVQPPAGSQLPPESTILTVLDVAAVVTRYGSFEIWVLQDQPASLPIDQLIVMFVSLTEMQIEKLRQAGY